MTKDDMLVLAERRPTSATLTARSIARHIRDHQNDPHLANIIVWLCEQVETLTHELAETTSTLGRVTEAARRAEEALRATKDREAGR